MHGSVIWYEDIQTKEFVKIPVHAFFKGESVALKLIYGGDVKPLVIYPAQKAEYIEPLTDLQLMFKKRLVKDTSFLVVVGYSFRDEYIIHMLWDAARVNENLHVVLISPNAQKIFDERLRFINRAKNDKSRIHDRVICLPYPFATVIRLLKNDYLTKLGQICEFEKQLLDQEKLGVKPVWYELLRMCLEGEYMSKAEFVLQEKIRKDWNEIEFSQPQQGLLLSFKGLLQSVILNDGSEKAWLTRVNTEFKRFSAKNLRVKTSRGVTFTFDFQYNGNILDMQEILERWIKPLINERKLKTELLTPKFKMSLQRLSFSLKKLQDFYNYLTILNRGINWQKYEETKNDSNTVKTNIQNCKNAAKANRWNSNDPERWTLEIEKGRLQALLNGESLELKLQPVQGD